MYILELLISEYIYKSFLNSLLILWHKMEFYFNF